MVSYSPVAVVMGGTALLAVLVLTGAGRPVNAVAADELWVGHQVIFGKTSVPFMGDKETRLTSYLLAKVKHNGSAVELTQITCKVEFSEIAGIKVNIPTEALLKLPEAHIRFEPKAGLFRAKAWFVGWRKQDIDGDGAPGLSVVVEASICSGKIHVASATWSAAVGRRTEDGMIGKIAVDVKQQILGSDSVCLRLFSADSEEHQTGAFVYRRVSPTSTCKSLLKSAWPIRAEVKNQDLAP